MSFFALPPVSVYVAARRNDPCSLSAGGSAHYGNVCAFAPDDEPGETTIPEWNERSSGQVLRSWGWSPILRCRCGGRLQPRFRWACCAGGWPIAAAGFDKLAASAPVS